MLRRTCYYTGRVQGVGFRYTVHNLSLRHNVQGYVRNTADGRVEVVMEGPTEDMERLQEDIRQRMGDYIRKVDVVESPATGEFSQFTIRH